MTTILWRMLNLVLLIIAAPLITGMVRPVQPSMQGGAGPGILQPYRDLWKYLRLLPNLPDPGRWLATPDQTAVARGPSWVFRCAPTVVWSCYALIAFLIPIVAVPASTHAVAAGSDLLTVVSLLGLATFMLNQAALDSGSSFGGMGSSRAMTIHILVEITLITAVAALGIKTGTTDLNAIFRKLDSPAWGDPALWLVILSLTIAALAEAGRMPFDDEGTHLELTMNEHAGLIEFSGSDFGVVEWAEALRITLFLSLIANLLFPGSLFMVGGSGFSLWAALLLFPIKLGALCIVLAWWELAWVKLRQSDAVRLLGFGWILALAASLLGLL